MTRAQKIGNVIATILKGTAKVALTLLQVVLSILQVILMIFGLIFRLFFSLLRMGTF